jgi:hypothetical protein
MTETTLTFSKRFDDGHYTISRVDYETVRQVRGFNRRARASTRIYQIDGKRVAKVVWLARKAAAKAEG